MLHSLDNWGALIDPFEIPEFFFLGVVLMGLGIVGEYIGRIYEEIRQRPRFIIKSILSPNKSDS